LGPRPSNGTVAISRKGLAGPSISAEKKQRDDEPVMIATATSGSCSRLRNLKRHEREVAAEDDGPQEDRPLERGPQPRDRVEQRRAGGVVLGHVAPARKSWLISAHSITPRGGNGEDEDGVDAPASQAQVGNAFMQLQPREEGGDADDRRRPR